MGAFRWEAAEKDVAVVQWGDGGGMIEHFCSLIVEKRADARNVLDVQFGGQCRV